MLRRTVVLFLLLFSISTALATIFAAGDMPVDGNSEFYFTRLAYSENGSRGWGRFVPKNFRCLGFGGGNFFPAQGLGWSMDSPGAGCKYMGGIQRQTNLHVFPNPDMISITDEIFKFPYAYIVEPGGLHRPVDGPCHLQFRPRGRLGNCGRSLLSSEVHRPGIPAGNEFYHLCDDALKEV